MQRKVGIALGSLFTALIEGCVGREPLGETGGSGESDSSGGSEGSTSMTSEASTGPLTTTDSDIPPCNGPEMWTDTVEIDRALVDGYDVGATLPQELCATICTSDRIFDSVTGCVLTGAEVDPDPSTSDGTTGDGTTGDGTTGDGTTGDATTGVVTTSPTSAEDSGDEGGGPGTGTATDGDVPNATVDCTFVFDTCAEGGRRSAELVTRGDCDTIDPIAGWYARMAHSEAASVTSFLRLQVELRRHGAPPELLARLWSAARDEVRHARAMRRLARARDVEPTRPRHEPRSDRTLEELARENAVEGCVAETWSALLCAWQARHCPSRELAEILRGIATDETRHAELAWEIDAWVRARLDADARARVDAARRDAAARLVAKADTEGGEPVRAELGLPRPAAARTLADGLRAALWA